MNENDISFKGAALFRRWSFPRTLARPRRPVSRMAIYGTVFVHFEAQACVAQMRFQQLCVTVTRFFPSPNKPNKYLARSSK